MLTSEEEQTIEDLEWLRRYLCYGSSAGSARLISDVDEAIQAIQKVADIREALTQDCAGCKHMAENDPCTLNCDKEWVFRWE